MAGGAIAKVDRVSTIEYHQISDSLSENVLEGPRQEIDHLPGSHRDGVSLLQEQDDISALEFRAGDLAAGRLARHVARLDDKRSSVPDSHAALEITACYAFPDFVSLLLERDFSLKELASNLPSDIEPPLGTLYQCLQSIDISHSRTSNFGQTSLPFATRTLTRINESAGGDILL